MVRLELIVPVVMTPPEILVTLLFTCPLLINPLLFVRFEMFAPLTTMPPALIIPDTSNLAVGTVPDAIFEPFRLETVTCEALIEPAVTAPRLALIAAKLETLSFDASIVDAAIFPPVIAFD